MPNGNDFPGLPVGPQGILGGALAGNMAQQAGGATPPGTASIWDRLLGNVGRTLSGGREGLLSPEGMQSAGRQGLLAAGASLLKGMTPTTQPRSFLGDLGSALEAGQAGAQQGMAGGVAQEKQIRENEYQQKLQEWQARGGTQEELLSLQQEYQDVGGAQITGAMIASQNKLNAPKLEEVFNDETQKFEIARVTPTGEIIEFTGRTGTKEQARLNEQFRRNELKMGEQVRFAKDVGDEFMDTVRLTREARTNIVEPAIAAIKEAQRRGVMPAAEQILALYGLVRGVDPNSVVRPGEIDLFTEAMSLRVEAERMWQKLDKNPEMGSAIPMSQLAPMLRTLERLRAGAFRRESDVFDEYNLRFDEPALSNITRGMYLPKPKGYVSQADRDAFQKSLQAEGDVLAEQRQQRLRDAAAGGNEGVTHLGPGQSITGTVSPYIHQGG